MKTIAALLCLVVFANAMSLDLFENWAVKHGKVYKSQVEKTKRFGVWQSNKATIEKLNKESTTGAVFGFNKFTDMTPVEFKQFLSGYKVTEGDGFCTMSPNATQPGPATFDWRDKKALVPVKDQAQCGSCWTFSTVANAESVWFLAGHPLASLSEQQLVDCDHTCDPDSPTDCNDGCNGGLPSLSFDYVIKNGLEGEGDYKYTAKDGKCNYQASKVVAKFKSCLNVPKDLVAVRDLLPQLGPLSIGVDAEPWQFYNGGILSSACPNKDSDLDHAVLLVGYGTEGGKDFWIIRNSWGADWGENGYIRVLRSAKNLCGVINDAVTLVA